MYSVADVYDNVKRFNFSDRFAEFSRVELDVSDGEYKASGTKSGRTLTGSSPWATKQVAEDVLKQVRGFSYQPYTANSVALDPAVELGDGIFVSDVFSSIYTMETKFGKTYVADISAPSEEETDHEFPYESQSQRESKRISRRVSQTESRLDVQAGEISAKVSSVVGDKTSSFSWSLKEDKWEIRANGKLILKVDEEGLYVNGNGRFTGNVYAGNIQEGGAGSGRIGTGILSSGVQTSLARADFSKDVFEGTGSATLLRCESMIFDDYIIARQSVTINGQTIRYLGWTYPSPL